MSKISDDAAAVPTSGDLIPVVRTSLPVADQNVTYEWDVLVSQIDHGSVTGLADDDHPIYLKADGTRAITGPLATSFVSPDDTTPGYLEGKLVAGVNITLTPSGGPGNEILTIESTGASATYTEVTVAATTDTLDSTVDGTHRTYTANDDGPDITITLNSGVAGESCLLSLFGTAGIAFSEGTATLVGPGLTTFSVSPGESVQVIWRTATEVWILPHFYRPISVFQGAPGGENPPKTSNLISLVFEGASVVNAAGQVTITTPGTATALSYDNGTSGLTATNTQAAIDELAASGGGGISVQAAVVGTTDSLQTAENDFWIPYTNAGAVTITVNQGVAGESCIVALASATGSLALVAGAGVTLKSVGGLTDVTSENGQAVVFWRTATEVWLSGDLA